MKARIWTVCLVVTLLAIGGLGLAILVAADDVLAPGLLLIGISILGAAVLLRSRSPAVPPDQFTDDSKRLADQMRDDIEYEAERRRRGDFDNNSFDNDGADRFDR